jgi:hypothetical protein
VVFPVRNLEQVLWWVPIVPTFFSSLVCVFFLFGFFFFFFGISFSLPPFSSSVLDLSLEWLRNGDDDDDDVQGFVLDCAVIFRSSWLAPAAGFFEVKTDFCCCEV